MKNIIIACMFLCPTLLWADSWDNMTYEQAEQTVKLLETDPYILDYCDCCSHDGEYAVDVYLMKVLSTEIVPCEWNSEYFSIKAQVEVLAEIPYKEKGLVLDSSQAFYEWEKEILITMNYTWIYNKEVEKAAPIYTVVPYDVYGNQKSNSGYCKDLTAFPKPEGIENEAYEDWYNEKANVK